MCTRFTSRTEFLQVKAMQRQDDKNAYVLALISLPQGYLLVILISEMNCFLKNSTKV